MPERKATAVRRGKGARIKRAAIDGSGTPQELVPRPLSKDDDRVVREVVARARTRLRESLGTTACRYAAIDDDAQWVEERLRARSRRWSLADALRILRGIESYALPHSPKEKRNAEVNEVLRRVRSARMRLLEAYSLHPEYSGIADLIRRVAIESGAVEYESDPRVESVLRPLRDLLGSVHERVVVASADADQEALAVVDFLPDAATKGKLREHRTTAKDGSTMSTFEGDPRAWMEPFTAPSIKGTINRTPSPNKKRGTS